MTKKEIPFLVVCALIGIMLGAGPVVAQSWTQVTKRIASDGDVQDWFGWSVSLDGDRAIVGAPADFANGLFYSGAAYAFAWDGGAWTEVAKLTASDGTYNDYFGWSVSLDGDRALVGAYLDNEGSAADVGSAYVYEWDGSAWVETKLTASDGETGDEFGYSVSLAGDRALVGAWRDDDNGQDSGSAYFFETSAILPVELAAFRAVSDGEAVVLS